MILNVFTLFHVLISLLGIGSGLMVMFGFLSSKRLDGWTAVYLVSTAATSLTGFLDNPHGARPSGRMPKLLNAKEAKDVANYLLQGVNVSLPQGKGSTTFQYLEGPFDR